MKLSVRSDLSHARLTTYSVEAAEQDGHLLTRGGKCLVHLDHSPHPHMLHIHHLLPKSWGGKTTPGNLITVCPTGHYNIHVLLDLARSLGAWPSWGDLKTYGYRDRQAALLGWQAYRSV